MKQETHAAIIRFEPFDGYFEAAFFTDEVDDDKGLWDIGDDAANLAMQEISEMLAFAENLLEESVESGIADDWDIPAIESYLRSKNFGADFWFSRNGHGTGFFDAHLNNRALPKDYLDKLQARAEKYGEAYLEEMFSYPEEA